MLLLSSVYKKILENFWLMFLCIGLFLLCTPEVSITLYSQKCWLCITFFTIEWQYIKPYFKPNWAMNDLYIWSCKMIPNCAAINQAIVDQDPDPKISNSEETEI
jgi:hypothetical protein